MVKKFLLVAVALLLVAGMAQANTVSIGFNGNLTTSDVAGVVPAANWNIVTGGSGTGLALNAATGLDSGVTMTWSEEQSWNPSNAPTGGTVGDQHLMSGGARSFSIAPTVGEGDCQFLLSNLNAQFGNTYDVYVYFSDVGYGWIGGGATIYASAASDYSANVSSPTSIASPFASQAVAPANGSSFNGTWNLNSNYVKFEGMTADSLTITMFITSRNTTWAGIITNGIQIDGTPPPPPPPTPEPAGLGLIGVALLALRRDARKSCFPCC